MKSLIIILSLGFIEIPYENKLTCMEQGSMWLEMHSKHQATGDKNQGLYTKDGKLVYGFFCI
jgi:hypothetical protein